MICNVIACKMIINLDNHVSPSYLVWTMYNCKCLIINIKIFLHIKQTSTSLFSIHAPLSYCVSPSYSPGCEGIMPIGIWDIPGRVAGGRALITWSAITRVSSKVASSRHWTPQTLALLLRPSCPWALRHLQVRFLAAIAALSIWVLILAIFPVNCTLFVFVLRLPRNNQVRAWPPCQCCQWWPGAAPSVDYVKW